jgi:putative redox protein
MGAMTTMTCRYEGQLRCQAVHVASAAELLTDAPLDNQGRGEAFSPTDLLATALATCILTIMGITAERHGFAIEGSEARVEKTMTSSGVRRIELLTVWITLPAGLEDSQRELLKRAGEGCPVKRSLEGAVPMELHWQ